MIKYASMQVCNYEIMQVCKYASILTKAKRYICPQLRHFFMQGVKNNVSKQICVQFLQEGKNYLHKLREELKKSEAQKSKTDIICNICLLWGTRKNNAMVNVTIVLIGGMTPKIAQKVLKTLKPKKLKLEP